MIGDEPGRHTLVFAHGMGADQSCWRDVAPAFADTHRVVLFDHVGCGRGSAANFDFERHATLEGYADDILAILGALAVEKATYVGHSMSGAMGVVCAVKAPQHFAKLVLVATSARFVDDPPEYRGGFSAADIDGLLELMESNFLGWATALASAASPDPAVSEEIQRNLGALDPTIARCLASAVLRADIRDWLPRVTVPTLVVQCTRDDLVPVSVGETLARLLPNGALRLLEAGGHAPQISHPRDVQAIVRETLAVHSYRSP